MIIIQTNISDNMLKELKIKNGILELEFNQYTYEYTVLVDENILSLEFEYELENNSQLEIINNKINEGENIVSLRVFNEEDEIIYTFYVYKEKTNMVNGIDVYKESLEVSANNEISLYKVQILTAGIFLVIIILFSIIFKRKRT